MPKRIAIAVAVLILTGLILRSFFLSRGFYGDEAITLLSVSGSFTDIIPSLVEFDSHPPLTSFLLYFWMNLSDNEIFIRYYFILFGIGLLLIIYLLAREYYSNRKIALLAVLIAALSPLLVSLSQYVRNYIDSAFWMVSSVYFFLLIMRGKGSRRVWLGYLAVNIFSLYTFYFSMVMILCQVFYVLIFKLRQKELMRKWIFSMALTALLFLPWAPFFLKQALNTGSSKYLPWGGFGFKAFGLNLGIYARNIASLFGMDYGFLVYPQGIINRFGKGTLLFMVAAAFSALIVLLIYTLRRLKIRFSARSEEAWFLIFFSVLPLLVSWVAVKFTKSMPNSKYLAAPFCVFAVFLAFFFYSLIKERRKTGIFLLILFLAFSWARLPAAVTPEYEAKNAIAYIREDARYGDCILMGGKLVGGEVLSLPLIETGDYIYESDQKTGRYVISPGRKQEIIKEKLSAFDRVWFIRCYGNAEIFGGNALVYDFLRAYGWNEASKRKFNNLEVILMIKGPEEPNI